MLELTKTPLINEKLNFTYRNASYSVPLKVLEKYRLSSKSEKTCSIKEVFGDLIEKYGEPALCLRGLRGREGLTQIEFAKKLGITQQNLSAMENGRRSIGKVMAMRIAKVFKMNYRLFL